MLQFDEGNVGQTETEVLGMSVRGTVRFNSPHCSRLPYRIVGPGGQENGSSEEEVKEDGFLPWHAKDLTKRKFEWHWATAGH